MFIGRVILALKKILLQDAAFQQAAENVFYSLSTAPGVEANRSNPLDFQGVIRDEDRKKSAFGLFQHPVIKKAAFGRPSTIQN
jgi:hypothetical protein